MMLESYMEIFCLTFVATKRFLRISQSADFKQKNSKSAEVVFSVSTNNPKILVMNNKYQRIVVDTEITKRKWMSTTWCTSLPETFYMK